MIKSAITSNISAINRVIRPGDVFKHYKGSIYRVNMIAKHTETEENFVIYHDVTQPEQVWARPVQMFNQYITLNDRNELRFSKSEKPLNLVQE